MLPLQIRVKREWMNRTVHRTLTLPELPNLVGDRKHRICNTGYIFVWHFSFQSPNNMWGIPELPSRSFPTKLCFVDAVWVPVFSMPQFHLVFNMKEHRKLYSEEIGAGGKEILKVSALAEHPCVALWLSCWHIDTQLSPGVLWAGSSEWRQMNLASQLWICPFLSCRPP